MAGNRRLAYLWLGHIALIPAAMFLATLRLPVLLNAPQIVLLPIASLVFAQAFLLGVWFVFSPSTWWRRLLGLLGGSAFLTAVALWGFWWQEWHTPLVIILGTLLVGIVLREASLRIIRAETPWDQRIRFSIGRLMLAIIVMALLIAGARLSRESYEDGIPGLPDLIWATFLVIEGFGAAWAILTSNLFTAGATLILVSALIMGVLLGYSMGAGEPQEYLYVTVLMTLYSVIILGSLLVVRSCGFRLVRGKHAAERQVESEAMV